ncbi:MAG: hypothetical protein GXZ15_05945 [Campylobacter sp.]|nr:hypothetical protein [Campylobacter sp.]
MFRFILGALFWSTFFISGLFGKSVILENDNIISSNTLIQMQVMGDELKEKTGIFLGVVAIETLNGQAINEKAKEISQNLEAPYAFIMLVTLDKKVEIYMSEDVKLNRKEILSPSPRKGTIIPLLVASKGKEDPYNPALINGYADIAERLASSKNIVLDSAVGNTNKVVINLIRFFVYGSIILVLLSGVYYKIKRKINGKR